MNYLSLVLAALAAVAVAYLLSRPRKAAAKAAPTPRPPSAAHPSTAGRTASSTTAPQPDPHPLVRTESPQFEALLGSFHRALGAELPLRDAEEIGSLLARIPRPPSALHKLVSPQFLADASTAELSTMVMAEPQVAAKVLAVVNSPLYGLKSPLGSIGQAVTFLGLNTVRGICLQYLLDASFRSDDPEVRKIFAELWNASALASELCFKLAQLLELPQPGALVTQVVLSFLGRAASHSLLPQNVVLPMMHKGLLERSRVEQDALGLCASELGSLLMQQWQLPPSIVTQVRTIDLVLLTPVEAAPRESAVAMALCYFCARVGEKLAQGEMEDLATFQLEQEHSAEFYYLQGYLRQPALARLHEFVRLPEVLSSVNTMVQAMRLRG